MERKWCKVMSDMIGRQAAIDTAGLEEEIRCEMCKNPMHTDRGCDGNCKYDQNLYKRITQILNKRIMPLPSAQPDESKYEYHYDHTDCIWYRPEARNRCPTTCAQYRDGWNDAMNYIFRDGKGYRPYKRDKQYEE
jgi:hypothetical protein